MGCFNMRCAATGVPIIHGTKVVMFDLTSAYPHHVQKELGFDVFGDHYAVMSMPRFGVYNDYGDIEDEEDHGWTPINTRLKQEAVQMRLIPKFEGDRAEYDERDYEREHRMFILRDAYDLMIKHSSEDKIFYGDEFDTWGQRHAQNQMLFRSLCNFEDDRSQELLEEGADKLLIRTLNRSKAEDYAYSGFCLGREDKSIWLDLMMQDTTLGDFYYKYISKLRRSTDVAHWTLEPSHYGGQTVDEDVLVMRQIGTRYLESFFKEMREEYD